MSASIHQELTPVIALHCSLGSGRQWTRLAEALGRGFEVIAPDLSGYGKNIARPLLPTTLADEVALLGPTSRPLATSIQAIHVSDGARVMERRSTDGFVVPSAPRGPDFRCCGWICSASARFASR